MDPAESLFRASAAGQRFPVPDLNRMASCFIPVLTALMLPRLKYLSGVVVLSLGCSLVAAENPARVTTVRAGKVLEIKATMPAGITEVEIRIESDRNQRISKISDVSKLNPTAASAAPASEREIFYPVVDLALQPGMEGVITFSSAPATCYINQNFHKAAVAAAARTVVPGDRLCYWENAVFVAPASAAVREFHLRFRAPVTHGRLDRPIALLSEQWTGRISLHTMDGRELGATVVTQPVLSPRGAPAGELLSADRLRESVVESVGYILRSQERNPASPVVGGLNLFYDHDASTYRSNYWIWGWGPAVRMLLEADRVPEVARRFEPGLLPRVADEIGQASLRFIVMDPTHPARGVPVSRWNRNLGFATGYEERVSVADAQFLAGWAWLPLYRSNGNQAYLDSAKTLADATERLTAEFGLIRQDYYEEPKKWAEHILDESGFAMEGSAELYATTHDPRHREIGHTYFERVRLKLERPDGTWNRGWSQETGIMPAVFITKGMGWAMEGLLAAHRALPGEGYLERAQKMAEHLLRWQKPDGSWAFNADKPAAEVGVGEKGTALWSLLFYRLHRETKDPRHLHAAQQALKWCVANQYFGSDVEARGAILGSATDAAVGYRQWFQVSCTYTSAFFALAAMEELQRGIRREP